MNDVLLQNPNLLFFVLVCSSMSWDFCQFCPHSSMILYTKGPKLPPPPPSQKRIPGWLSGFICDAVQEKEKKPKKGGIVHLNSVLGF